MGIQNCVPGANKQYLGARVNLLRLPKHLPATPKHLSAAPKHLPRGHEHLLRHSDISSAQLNVWLSPQASPWNRRGPPRRKHTLPWGAQAPPWMSPAEPWRRPESPWAHQGLQSTQALKECWSCNLWSPAWRHPCVIHTDASIRGICSMVCQGLSWIIES